MTDAERPPEVAEETDVAPGAALRQARERLGLDRAAIAESLHLDEKVVAALEEGREEDLPATAYIRGYVRGYARLVGIEADELATRFNAPALDRPLRSMMGLVPAKPSLSHRAQRHSGWLIAGIVLAVLVAAAIVLWLVAPSFDWPLGRGEAAVDAVEQAAPVPARSSAAAEDGDSAATASTPEPPTPDEAAASPPPRDDDAASAPSADAVAFPSESAAQDTLTFTFEDDSWVEVRDKNGDRIHADLGASGDSLELAGEGPFDILIGAASGVQLAFNGSAVTLAPHTRDDVAQLVVGH